MLVGIGGGMVIVSMAVIGRYVKWQVVVVVVVGSAIRTCANYCIPSSPSGM